MMSGQKVLVTGGMGFIGKVLVRKLLAGTDYDVVVVDNLSSSVLDASLAGNERVAFINANFEEWIPPDGERYRQIYHLASPVGPVGVLKWKGRMGRIIINNLYRAAEMAMAMDARLVYVSTSEVYGKHPDNEKEGQREDIDKIVPANITVRLEYGVAKLLGEIMLKNLSRDGSLKHNCIRPFNVVGPAQNDELGFVIPRFLKQALKGDPITIYGDGRQKRTFTHVEDFVDGMFLVMESGVTGEIFNVGNPANLVSILELAEKIKKATNSKSEIRFVEPKALFGDDFAEAWNKIPNVDKLVATVGWKPKWPVDAIIAQVAEMSGSYLMNKTVTR